MKKAEFQKLIAQKIAALAAMRGTMATVATPSNQDCQNAAGWRGEQDALEAVKDFLNGGTWGKIYFER